jgi:hypothetical protein
MRKEDLSIDTTFDPFQFSLDNTFKQFFIYKYLAKKLVKLKCI